MECETCPISGFCDAYKEARRDNESSYHPQTVVRVSEWSDDCPLVNLIKHENNKEEE